MSDHASSALEEERLSAEDEFREGLLRLRGLVLTRLIEILEAGAPSSSPSSATTAGTARAAKAAGSGAAPAPYMSAAIRFLKDQNAWLDDPTDAAALDALLGALPEGPLKGEASFDDDDEEDEQETDRSL